MKFYLIFFLTLKTLQLTVAVNYNVVCYYDPASRGRSGLGKFSLDDLEKALEYCTHVIYGYAGIDSLSLQMKSRANASEVTALKDKYPHIKYLLSVGTHTNLSSNFTNKYIQVLEAGAEAQKAFVDSALYLLRSYKFDGLDLAFQLPADKDNNQRASNIHWKNLRKHFIKISKTTDVEKNDLKMKFSILLDNLRNAFKPNNFMLSLTVPPNFNTSLYLNATAIINNLDFINLQTFDFTTPELMPTEATYTAPLYVVPIKGNPNPEHSIDYQVNFWISQRIPSHKINVGIAAFGRAWKMSNASTADGFPKVIATRGPAPTTSITNMPGILTWMEICAMLQNVNRTTDHGPLLSVLDPYKDFVTYAFRPADAKGGYGVWISYDDPKIAALKASYVKNRHLGGVAFYDVSLDDFHGFCNGDTFPMLRYIKYIFS